MFMPVGATAIPYPIEGGVFAQVVDVPMGTPRDPQVVSDPGTNSAGAECTSDVEVGTLCEADPAEAPYRNDAFAG
jgi:hypothetical protein